jgi:hypothetical protein
MTAAVESGESGHTLMERSVFGLLKSSAQRYRSRVYSMIYLSADSAVAREVAGWAERWVLLQMPGGLPRPGGPSSFFGIEKIFARPGAFRASLPSHPFLNDRGLELGERPNGGSPIL